MGLCMIVGAGVGWCVGEAWLASPGAQLSALVIGIVVGQAAFKLFSKTHEDT